MGRGDLTNQQWARLEPLLAKGKKSGRRPRWSKRQLIDGIRWRTRTGAPRRDVPARYGPWQTVYGLFRRWQRDGTWQRILTRLQAQADVKGLITWEVSVDSTVARAISTPRAPAIGGSATRSTGRVDTSPKSMPRALPGRAELQAAPGGRGWPAAAVDRGDRRPARRQPAVWGGPWRHPGPAPGPGAAPHAARPGAGRQGRQLPGQPGLPTPSQDRLHHPREGRQAAHRRARAARAAGRRPSTRWPTGCGMRWSAGSTGASGIGWWPLGTTSWPSAMPRPCASPRSTSGYDF